MKKALEQWQARGNFARIVAAENGKCDSVQIWGARQKWLREANLASAVANAARAKRVRLARDIDGDADSEIELRGDTLIRFQHVEADVEGRRRGDEYKEWAKSGSSRQVDPGEDAARKRAEFPSAIRRVVLKKVEKKKAGKYDETISLLVYVNLGTYGLHKEELEFELVESTRSAACQFRNVWAWWSGRLYRCWPSPFLGSATSFRPGPGSPSRVEGYRAFRSVFGSEQCL